MAKPKKVEEQPKFVEKAKRTSTPVNVDSVEAFTKDTDRMVTGVFRNIESPGQPARVTMRLYKGQQPFNQVFEDGVLYTIPLSIARGIKEYCQHVKHDFLLGDDGKQLKVNKPFTRYEFVAAEFR